MIIIRFPDNETKRNALGYLAGRFSGKSWSTGELMVPEEALAHLAAEGIRFTVEGLGSKPSVPKPARRNLRAGNCR
jgi:hypothetical protein